MDGLHIPKCRTLSHQRGMTLRTCKHGKKANLARRSRRQAQGNSLRPLLQVILAPGNWMRTLTAFLPAQCTGNTQRTIPGAERKWKVLANSPYGRGSLSTAISKIVTRLVRRYDQERQSDAAVHWDTTRPKLLKAFAKKKKSSTRLLGERLASNSFMKEAARRGSRIARIPQKSLTYFRAIQGHSGGITIAPELMGHIDWKDFVFHRGCSFSFQSILENGLIAGGTQSKEGRQTISFTPLNPFGENPDEEEPSDDIAIPQQVHGNVIRMPFVV